MIAAYLLELIKAVPAAEQVMQQLIRLYVAWKIDSNAKQTQARDDRDDAVIDGIAGAGLPKLCEQCPFASVLASGQHIGVPKGSSVPGDGNGST